MAVTETREVHEAGWLERLGSSFKGVLTGIVCVAGATAMIFWNEGRAVKTARRLAEGAGAVVSVPADKVDPANEGKLVHVSGRAETAETLADAQFGVSAKAIGLRRDVEIFQWVEEREVTREKKGDKTIEKTTYSYKTMWCSKPVDSSGFKEAGHENPVASLPFGDETTLAKEVTLGAFRLSELNIRRMGGWKAFPFAPDFKVPETLKGGQFQNGFIYVPSVKSVSAEVKSAAGSPLAAAAAKAVTNAVATALRDVTAKPEVGDLRVRFQVLEPHDLSLCQMQKGNSFVPWPAKDGKTLALQQDGLHEAAAMFADAQSGNAKLTWLLRALGFLLMFAGFKMVFGPLSALVDVVPVLGKVVALGVGLVSFVLTAALGTLTAGIAWIYYRPVLGISLIVVSVALVVFLSTRKRKAVPAPASV